MPIPQLRGHIRQVSTPNVDSVDVELHSCFRCKVMYLEQTTQLALHGLADSPISLKLRQEVPKLSLRSTLIWQRWVHVRLRVASSTKVISGTTVSLASASNCRDAPGSNSPRVGGVQEWSRAWYALVTAFVRLLLMAVRGTRFPSV